jgi:hypothetical protein
VVKRRETDTAQRPGALRFRATISTRINPVLLVLITIVGGLARPGILRAQSDETVYADALANGWQNWSWTTVNLSNTQPVQAGGDSIGVSATAYQALYLHHDAFDSSLYGNLVFWINGGATGGQLLQVQATLNGTAQTVVALPALAANSWQQISIPLSSLGVQSKTQSRRVLDPGPQRYDPANVLRGYHLAQGTAGAFGGQRHGGYDADRAYVGRAIVRSQRSGLGLNLRYADNHRSIGRDGQPGIALPRRIAVRRLSLGDQYDR